MFAAAFLFGMHDERIGPDNRGGGKEKIIDGKRKNKSVLYLILIF